MVPPRQRTGATVRDVPTVVPPDPQSGRGVAGGAPSATVAPGLRRWRTVGYLLLLGEALAPLGLAGWALVIIVTGRAVVIRNDLLVGLGMLVTGLGLVLVATRVRQGRPAVRVAALLWQALLVLAVAVPMWQVGRAPLGGAVAVWAVATGVVTLKATAGEDRRGSSRPR